MTTRLIHYLSRPLFKMSGSAIGIQQLMYTFYVSISLLKPNIASLENMMPRIVGVG